VGGLPILSDHEGRLASAFGIRFALSDYLIKVYKDFGVDLPVINGQPRWTLSMSTRYVISMDGPIAYAACIKRTPHEASSDRGPALVRPPRRPAGGPNKLLFL
jgi:peroxiredoxin